MISPYITIAGGAALNGVVQVALAEYRKWRDSRQRITMVRTWRGQYVDAVKLYERRLLIAFWSSVVIFIGFGFAAMITVSKMPPLTVDSVVIPRSPPPASQTPASPKTS